MQRAIVLAVRDQGGFASGRVVVAHQGVSRTLTRPFATVKIHGSTDAAPPYHMQGVGEDEAGQEIKLSVRAHRNFDVEIEVFTEEVEGNSDARAQAEDLSLRLLHESVNETFKAAGFLARGVGPILSRPDIGGVDYEGRASFSLRCRTVREVEEFATVIETVDVTNSDTGETVTATVAVE